MALEDIPVENRATEEHGDRYPNIYDLLSNLQAHADLPNGPIERIEVTCLANGEGNCRWWTPRAEEPVGVHLPDPRLP